MHRKQLFNIADKFRTTSMVEKVSIAIDDVAENGGQQEVDMLYETLAALKMVRSVGDPHEPNK